jgi:hypothetical protein
MLVSFKVAKFMAMESVYGKMEPSILETMYMARKKGMANIHTKMEGLTGAYGKRESLMNFAILSGRINNSIYIDFFV